MIRSIKRFIVLFFALAPWMCALGQKLKPVPLLFNKVRLPSEHTQVAVASIIDARCAQEPLGYVRAGSGLSTVAAHFRPDSLLYALQRVFAIRRGQPKGTLHLRMTHAHIQQARENTLDQTEVGIRLQVYAQDGVDSAYLLGYQNVAKHFDDNSIQKMAKYLTEAFVTAVRPYANGAWLSQPAGKRVAMATLMLPDSLPRLFPQGTYPCLDEPLANGLLSQFSQFRANTPLPFEGEYVEPMQLINSVGLSRVVHVRDRNGIRINTLWGIVHEGIAYKNDMLGNYFEMMRRGDVYQVVSGGHKLNPNLIIPLAKWQLTTASKVVMVAASLFTPLILTPVTVQYFTEYEYVYKPTELIMPVSLNLVTGTFYPEYKPLSSPDFDRGQWPFIISLYWLRTELAFASLTATLSTRGAKVAERILTPGGHTRFELPNALHLAKLQFNTADSLLPIYLAPPSSQNASYHFSLAAEPGSAGKIIRLIEMDPALAARLNEGKK